MHSKKCFITFFFAALITVMSSTAIAAGPVVELPRQQAPKFFTRSKIITLSIGAAMMAADVISTQRALSVPGTREANPLGQSEGARLGLKLAGFGAGLGISYALHRTGHYKAARIVPIIIGVPSFAASIHNSGIHR